MGTEIIPVGDISVATDVSLTMALEKPDSLSAAKVGEIADERLAGLPAVEAAAAAAAVPAVSAELTARRVVVGVDVVSPADDDAAGGLASKHGGRLFGWLRTGGPSKWTRQFYRKHFGGITQSAKIPGVAYTERAPNGYVTRVIYDDAKQELPGLIIPGSAISGGGATYTERVGSDDYRVNITTGVREKIIPPDRTKVVVLGSSSMNKMLDDGAWAVWGAPLGISFIDLSTGGMCSEQLLAQWSRPLITNAAATIPTSGTVTITSTNVPSTVFGPFSWTGTLAGVPGTMSKPNNVTTGPWTFTPSAYPGAPVSVPTGTSFIPTGANFRNAVVVLNTPKNNLTNNGGGTTDVNALFEMTKQAYEFATATAKVVLVPGVFVDTNTPAVDANRTRIMAYNALCREYFGDRYIDMQEYLTSAQIWLDTGLTPDATDLAQQALGNKPPQLSLYTAGSWPSGTVDPLHMSVIAEFAMVAHWLGRHMTAVLNWF